MHDVNAVLSSQGVNLKLDFLGALLREGEDSTKFSEGSEVNGDKLLERGSFCEKTSVRKKN